MKPGAPMLSQALISCSPETEVHPASRAWLLASLMMKQMNLGRALLHQPLSVVGNLGVPDIGQLLGHDLSDARNGHLVREGVGG